MAIFSSKRAPFLHGLFGSGMFIFGFISAISMGVEIIGINQLAAGLLITATLTLATYLTIINVKVKVLYAREEYLFLLWLLLWSGIIAWVN